MEVRIKRGQEKRIGTAYKKQRGCRLAIHPNCTEDATCCAPGRLELSPNQMEKMKKGDIRLTHEDLRRNRTVQGGFIPLIIAALASSVAGGLIERSIAGAGLVWRRGDQNFKINHRGRGLHIVPWKGKLSGGSGFYHVHRDMVRPATSEDIKKIPINSRRIMQTIFNH